MNLIHAGGGEYWTKDDDEDDYTAVFTCYIRKDIVDGLKRELKEALYHWRDHLFSLHDVDMEGEHSLYLLSREPELRAEIEQMDSELGGGS